MAQEYCLIVIKPDGLEKSLTGSILTKLAEADFEIIAAKILRVSRELAENHYRHLKDKPFFADVVKYIQGDYHGRKKVMALVYMGENAVSRLREIVGATNPEEAKPTSIRGKFGRITSKGVYETVIHASSSTEDAEREIKLWFEPDDIICDIYPATTTTYKDFIKRVWV
jgi:nucleoside-diphosphate kinase